MTSGWMLRRGGASRRAVLAAAMGLAAAPALRAATPWPARPVRLMVAYPPGGVSDEIARVLARQVSALLGVPVLVVHRPGAGGTVAMEALAKAPPDGHTLCFSAITPLSLSPHLGPVGYDPWADIAPVVSVMFTPVLVVGTPAFTGRHFADLVAQARASQGAIRWASSGVGTTGHIVIEQVGRASGARLTHVPYKGGGQQIADALGGHVEVLSTNVGEQQLRHVAEGRFQPLAVGAPARLDSLPSVPTLAELGYPQANRVSVFGVFAPGGTPPAVLARLNALFNQALRTEAVREHMRAAHHVPTGGTAEAFGELIGREYQLNRDLATLPARP